jgi:hypothetical protein
MELEAAWYLSNPQIRQEEIEGEINFCSKNCFIEWINEARL